MKFYCKNCGTELKIPDNESELWECPLCEKTQGWMRPVPEYETVSHREARTGLKYPGTAPVYEKRFFLKPDTATIWISHEYKYALRDRKDYPKRMAYNIIIAATEAGAPPDGWRPEDEEEE